MKDSNLDFLHNPDWSGRIKLAGKVVFRRTLLTPDDIAAVKQKGPFHHNANEADMCEFAVDNVVLAKGKIVEKNGNIFFQPERNIKESEA